MSRPKGPTGPSSDHVESLPGTDASAISVEPTDPLTAGGPLRDTTAHPAIDMTPEPVIH